MSTQIHPSSKRIRGKNDPVEEGLKKAPKNSKLMATSIIGSLHAGEKASIPLDTHPEHAAALGRFLGHWAFLESQMVGVMQCLFHTSQAKATFVWQKFISAKAKIELAKKINFHCMQDATLKNELNDFLKRALDLNEIRNKYVHAIWGDDPNGNSNILIRFTSTGNQEKAEMLHESFTPVAIEDDAVKLAVLSQCLSDWQGRYTTMFGAPL